MRRRWPAVAAAVAVTTLLLTGCTTSSPAAEKTVVSTRTVTGSPTSSPTLPPPFALAAADVPAAPPGQALPAGEVEQSCPYIRAGLNIEPESTGNNFSDLEGNRVQRVTVLTTLQPAGCRFYFQSNFHPTGDILPSTYATAVDAHNAMVLTAQAGTTATGVPDFVPGVDGVSFQTHLNAPDNGQDWAFAFAKGTVMVVVRTDQTDTSENARSIARAVVDKF